jgi:ADP-ribosylglycohydrolase
MNPSAADSAAAHMCCPNSSGTTPPWSARVWQTGEWTDDTEMAFAILDVRATGSTGGAEVEAATFRRWYGSGPADVVNQTCAVLRQLKPYRRRAVERLG